MIINNGDENPFTRGKLFPHLSHRLWGSRYESDFDVTTSSWASSSYYVPPLRKIENFEYKKVPL